MIIKGPGLMSRMNITSTQGHNYHGPFTTVGYDNMRVVIHWLLHLYRNLPENVKIIFTYRILDEKICTFPYVCIAITIVKKLMRTYECLEIFSKEVYY